MRHRRSRDRISVRRHGFLGSRSSTSDEVAGRRISSVLLMTFESTRKVIIDAIDRGYRRIDRSNSNSPIGTPDLLSASHVDLPRSHLAASSRTRCLASYDRHRTAISIVLRAAKLVAHAISCSSSSAPGTSPPPGTSGAAGRRTVPGSPPSPARSRRGSAFTRSRRKSLFRSNCSCSGSSNSVELLVLRVVQFGLDGLLQLEQDRLDVLGLLVGPLGQLLLQAARSGPSCGLRGPAASDGANLVPEFEQLPLASPRTAPRRSPPPGASSTCADVQPGEAALLEHSRPP